MILTKSLLEPIRSLPDKTAIAAGSHRYTYAQLGTRAARVKEMIKKLGVQKGDRVGLLLLNDFRYLELMYGITALGAIVVPLNTRFTMQENVFVLNDAGIEVLFINKEFLPSINHLRESTGLKHVVLSEEADDEKLQEHADLLSYEEILHKETIEQLEYDDISEDDTAGLFYTGGTTGRSKGVMLSHKNLMSNAIHIALNFNYTKEDIYLHAAPMFHLADQASTFGVTLAGGTHTVVRSFTPKDVLAAVQKEKVTATMLVPTMINMLIHSADFDEYDTSTLRLILYGASPMAVELLLKTIKKLPNTGLIQAYGMTEASPVLTLFKWEDHLPGGTEKEVNRLKSCGRPVQFIDMKIVDENGIEVIDGEVGEFVAKGPNVMKGYWNLPEETAKNLRDGWYYTGDMGYKDDEGFYYVVDRAKDMIISGGENVYSIEIESALITHPAVFECAVFGAPHEKWGEVVLAAVVLQPGASASEEELLAFLRDQLANYKIPKGVEFMAELPKSGAGKILKRAIRDQYVNA